LDATFTPGYHDPNSQPQKEPNNVSMIAIQKTHIPARQATVTDRLSFGVPAECGGFTRLPRRRVRATVAGQ
jgi:hypothetical protein